MMNQSKARLVSTIERRQRSKEVSIPNEIQSSNFSKLAGIIVGRVISIHSVINLKVESPLFILFLLRERDRPGGIVPKEQSGLNGRLRKPYTPRDSMVYSSLAWSVKGGSGTIQERTGWIKLMSDHSPIVCQRRLALALMWSEFSFRSFNKENCWWSLTCQKAGDSSMIVSLLAALCHIYISRCSQP